MLPLILDFVVAILLAVTVCYCALLDRRIRTFRTGQESLKALVAELDSATARAERAVGGLGETTREAERALAGRIDEARTLARALTARSAGHPRPAMRRESA